jgi:hypothetical protein
MATENKPPNPNRVKAGRKSKRKGSSFERAVAKKLAAWWGNGSNWVRTPGSGSWGRGESKIGFRAHGDICTDATDFLFVVECKKQEKFELNQLITSDKSPISKWWTQTVEETPSHLFPLLVFSKNNCEPLVAVSADEFPNGVLNLEKLLLNKNHFKFNSSDLNLYIFSLTTLTEMSPEELKKELTEYE